MNFGSATGSEPYLHESPGTSDDRPAKRKRNKPTLSCGECVERKTKVCGFARNSSHILLLLIRVSRGYLRRGWGLIGLLTV